MTHHHDNNPVLPNARPRGHHGYFIPVIGDLTLSKEERRKIHLQRYYARNKAKILKRNKEWAKANPDCIKMLHKRSITKHSDSRSAIMRRWRQKNKSRVAAYQKQWSLKNPDKTRLHNQKRRMAKLNRASDPKIKEFLSKLRKARRIECYYCKAITPFKLGEIDHVIPISKGGPHEVGNLCFSCGFCNSSKHNKHVGRWQPMAPQPVLGL